MKERPVVSNSSPLIALGRIGQLSLLPALMKKIWIPPAVRLEVFGTDPLPDWIEEQPLEQPLAPRMAATRLGPGEREAIALALELSASEVILDDLAARHLAASLGLRPIGTLGLLLRAKRRGLIPQVRSYMEALQKQEFRISERLFSGILAAAGESSAAE
jgi:predicted nucleic acid-binding protein